MEGITEHQNYIHLDTEAVDKDIDDNKCHSSLFKEIAVPPINEIRIETQKMDEYQKEVLNIAIKYAKDIVKSRRSNNTTPDQIYIIGHGGAFHLTLITSTTL